MLKEIYSITNKTLSLEINKSKPEALKKQNITRTGVRVYDNGYIGVAGKVGRADEVQLAKQAKEFLSQKIPYTYELSSGKESRIIKSDIPHDNCFIDETKYIFNYLRDKYNDFSFSGRFSTQNEITLMKNDNNLDFYNEDNYMFFYLIYKEKISKQGFDGGLVYRIRNYNRDAFLNMWDQILEAQKKQVTIKDGVYPVIFLETLSAGGILDKFYDDLNGDLFGKGLSLLSGKSGQEVFNENFTLYKTSNPDDAIGVPFFDAEGVVTENYRYKLIENGKVITPLTDKKTAGEFNLPLTGSAFSTYDGVPYLRSYENIFKIKESDKSIKKILGGQEAIFVMTWFSGGFTPSGDFSAPLKMTFWFDGERLTGRLDNLQISSNIFDMFGKDFRGVSSDSFLPGIIRDKMLVIDMSVRKN